MKKVILYDEEESWDFEILALQTNIENEVSFVYQFNKFFETKFVKKTNLTVQKNKKNYDYSIFEYENPYDYCIYKIYKNKPNTDLLHKKSFDEENCLEDIFIPTPYLLSSYLKFNFLLKLPKPLIQDDLYKKIIFRNEIISKYKIVDKELKKIKNLLS